MAGNKRINNIILQQRDYALLDEMDTAMTVINREQTKIVAGFTSTTRVNTRLLALTQLGLLAPIDLGRNGLAYIRPGTSPYRADSFPAILFARHQLAINEVYIRVKFKAIPLSGVRFIRWTKFDEPISKTIPLKPDGYFELDAAGVVRPFFVEVDLGTEPQPVWRRKTNLYVRQLAASGEFQKIFGQPQFRVLVVANTDRRLAGIRSTVAKSTDKIFWFTTLDRIHRDGFWSPIWLRPNGDQRASLI